MKKTGAFLLVGIVLMSLLPAVVVAFPDKEINFLVGFAPGGSTDTTIRLIATSSSKLLGKPIVVINKPGAGGALALSTLANSKPDGYTLGNFNISAPIGNIIRNTDPYHVLKNFTLICNLTSFPNILVVPAKSPFQKLDQLLQEAKKKPRDLTCGTAGVGTSGHFGFEIFKNTAKIDITHVPHKGSTPAVVALLGGHIDCGVINSVDVVQHIKAGKLKALCVTSSQRMTELPDVPSIAEAGFPDAVMISWIGCAAPAGTPSAIVSKLADTFQKALNEKDNQEKLKEIGFTPDFMPPQSFSAFVEKEYNRFNKIAATAGIKE